MISMANFNKKPICPPFMDTVQRMVKPQKITMKLNSYVKIDASGNTPIRVLSDLTDTTFKAGNCDFEI